MPTIYLGIFTSTLNSLQFHQISCLLDILWVDFVIMCSLNNNCDIQWASLSGTPVMLYFTICSIPRTKKMHLGPCTLHTLHRAHPAPGTGTSFTGHTVLSFSNLFTFLATLNLNCMSFCAFNSLNYKQIPPVVSYPHIYRVLGNSLHNSTMRKNSRNNKLFNNLKTSIG